MGPPRLRCVLREGLTWIVSAASLARTIARKAWVTQIFVVVVISRRCRQWASLPSPRHLAHALMPPSRTCWLSDPAEESHISALVRETLERAGFSFTCRP